MAKILWIIHGAEVYGERRAILSLMRGVREISWKVEALSLTAGNFFQQLRAEGFPVQTMDVAHTPSLHLAQSRPGRIAQFLKLIAHQFSIRRRLLTEISARTPDIVHVLNRNIFPSVGWAAQKLGIPCFWEMTAAIGTSFPKSINRKVYQALLNHYRVQVLANSHYTAATVPKLWQPVRVMHLGADTSQFDPAKRFAIDRDTMQIPREALVYVIVSRIDASKGQRLFLEAHRGVNDPRMHVVLVGDATVPADQSFVRELRDKFTSNVHFAGYTEEPEAFIALSDVAVNSRCDAEPFGLSVVEAMLMGKPVLVHALGGPTETVVDGVTGWHVKEATVEAFSAGIRRTLSQRDKWDILGQAARERALNQFSLARQTERYREFVEAATIRSGDRTFRQ